MMSLNFFGQSDGYALFLTIGNYIFAGIFTTEAILKLIALDYRYFYTTEHYGRHYNRWNIFDFTIVMGTCIGILLKAITGTNIGSVATVVRTFRVGRIFRLAKTAKSL